jgi:hypothetical protein
MDVAETTLRKMYSSSPMLDFILILVTLSTYHV